MKDAIHSDLKPVNLKIAILLAAILIAVDTQGVISAIVGFWVLLATMRRAGSFENQDQRRRYLARAGIYIGAVLIIFVSIGVNNWIAKERADALVVAIKAFNQQYQRYPENLNELVPDFIEQVPVAKYGVLGNERFYYFSNPDSHSLFYVKFPPFGRPIYNFEKGKWGYLD